MMFEIRHVGRWMWLALTTPSNFFNLAQHAIGPLVFDRHRCGRRDDGVRVIPTAGGCGHERPDWWEPGILRWGTWQRWRDAYQNWRSKYFKFRRYGDWLPRLKRREDFGKPSRMGGTEWRQEWGAMPRTCSYCGGAHPDDLIAMVQRGWESHGTSKGYKKYIEPAGMYAYQVAMARAMRVPNPTAPPPVCSSVPYPGSPVPPVKLYIQHFSDEQIRRFNAALDVQAHARAYDGRRAVPADEFKAIRAGEVRTCQH